MLRAEAEPTFREELQQCVKIFKKEAAANFQQQAFTQSQLCGYTAYHDLIFYSLSEFSELTGGTSAKDLNLTIDHVDLGAGPVPGVLMRQQQDKGTKIRAFTTFHGALDDLVFTGQQQLRDRQGDEVKKWAEAVYPVPKSFKINSPQPPLLEDVPGMAKELLAKRAEAERQKESFKLEAEAVPLTTQEAAAVEDKEDEDSDEIEELVPEPLLPRGAGDKGKKGRPAKSAKRPGSAKSPAKARSIRTAKMTSFGKAASVVSVDAASVCDSRASTKKAKLSPR